MKTSYSGYLVLIKCDSSVPRYWLGWTANPAELLLLQITLTSSHPAELLWSEPGNEEEEEELAYPYIRYWVPDSDWFELPQSAVDEICARGGQQ